MANTTPKKRTLNDVYQGIKQISDDENIDFGLDNMTEEDFVKKYKGKESELYDALSGISDDEGVDFGIGTKEEWTGSFSRPSLTQRVQAAAESGTFPFVGGVGSQQGVSAENEKKPLWQMSAELGMQGRANREGVQRMESIKKGSALGNAFGGGKEPLTGKRYTESGDETNELGQWYDTQKNNQQRKAEADFGSNIEERFQEAERKLHESAERDRQRANENESALDYLVAGMQDPNVMTGPKLPEDSEETKERRAIYNALKEADKIVKAAQYSEKHNGWQEFWKSFGKKIGDWETWDMGVSSMLNNGTALRVIKKLEAANGDETKLTDSERDLLDALATQAVVEQYYHDRIGKGYNLGSGVAESVPFMAEMIINPMSGAGSATGKALGKYILKRFGVKGTMKGVMSSVKNKAWKQAGKELAGTVVRDVASEAAHLAGSAGMASTTGLANVIAGSYDRQIGKVTGNIGLDGSVDYTGRQQYEANARKAFWKEWGSRTIENFSESGMGAANEAVGDVTTRLIGKMFKGSTAKMVSKAYNGWRKFKKGNFGQVMKRAQWQGMVPEWLEEVEGGIANAIVVGDQTLDRDPETGVFNPGNMWDTFLQVAATSMMIGGGHVASYGIGKGVEAWSNANRLRQTDKEGQTVFGVDGWDDVKQAVEGAVRGISEGADGIGLSEEGKAAMRGLMEGRSQDEKQAIVDYFGARVKSEVSSAMIADETMTDDERELQNDYGRGYEAMMQSYDEDSEDADQRSMLAASDMAIERDQKRTALAERIGEETVEELEQSRLGGSDIDDQLARMMDEGKIGEGDMEAVKDYMKAHAAYRGVEDFVNEAGDAVSMQARMEMAPTRDEQGNVRKATMKNGKTLYIKGGEVKVQKDATIDTEGSTEALTAYDPEEEKNVFVNVDDIESMEEKGSDEVEREIEQRGSDFKEAMLNEINGVNTLSVGKEVTAENGMRGVVIAEDADNYILQMEDGQQLPVNKQQYEQELQARRMADYEERHRPTPALPAEGGSESTETPEGTETTEEVPSMEATEGAPLEYTPGMQLTLRDEDGNERQAAVLTDVRFELTNDGQFVESPEGRYIALSVEGEDGVVYKRDDILNKEVVRHEGEQAAEEEVPEASVNSEGVQEGVEEEPVSAEGTEISDNSEGTEMSEEVTNENQNENGESAKVQMPKHKVKRTINGEKIEVEEEDFEKVPAEDTYKYIYEEQIDEDFTLKDADDLVSKQLADARQKQKAAENNKNGGIETIRTRKKAARMSVGYWEKVQSLREEAKRRLFHEQAQEQLRQDEAAHAAAIERQQAEAAEREAKKAEKERTGANAAQPIVRERWDQAPKVAGYESEMDLPNGETLEGTYMLVESGAATPSHNPNNNFESSEGYPVDQNGNNINDRDYQRSPEAIEHTRNMAANYDGRALQSIPVVSSEGVVLSGNGRTMAGMLAAENNTDGVYKEKLKKRAREFGFTPEQVEGMQHPRVVFVPKEATPYTTETLAKFNESDTKQMSNSEKAFKYGKMIDNEAYGRIMRTINGYKSLAEFYANTAATDSVLGEMISSGIYNKNDVPSLYDGEKVSEATKGDIESILIGKFFEKNPDMVNMIVDMPNVRQMVVKAMQEIADNANLGTEYSLQQQFADAVKLIYEAKNAGTTVADHAKQYGLDFETGEIKTAADLQNLTVLMLGDVLSDKRTTRLKDVLTLYNDQSRDAANGQGNMFAMSEGGVQTQEEILRDVINTIYHGKSEDIGQQLRAAIERRQAESNEQAGDAVAGDETRAGGRTEERSGERTDESGERGAVEESREQRLQEERKQRILAEGTSYDKPFGLTPVSETMTPEEIGANVRRIVEGLKENEGSGDFEGFAYNGNYKKNAGHQVDEYLVSLSGVVPDETLRQWYESEGLKSRDDLRRLGEDLYGDNVRSQKSEGETAKPTKEQKELTKGVVEVLKETGVPTHYVTKKGQEMLDKYKEQAQKQKGEPVIFYSNAERAVEGIKQEKATAEQWLKMIEKNGGLKAGEDKWTGLSEWLKSNDKKSLTKQEVLDYIRENAIEIEDVEYGKSLFSPNAKINFESEIARGKAEGKSVEEVMEAWDKEFNDEILQAYHNGEFTIDENGKVVFSDENAPILRPINETRLNYTTDFLDNKREIALVVPTIESWNEDDQIHFGDAGEGRAVAWVRFGETTDADGKKVLVIDEIQSKRHQEGREKGYITESEKKRAALRDFRQQLLDKYNTRHLRDVERQATEEELQKLNELNEAIVGVPDAPFEKNWHEVAMKRMLRYAAENGYDKVAWTKGEQQAERYDLSKVVGEINATGWTNTYPGFRGIDAKLVSLYDKKDGLVTRLLVDKNGKIINDLNEEYIGKQLSDVVGKDLSARLLEDGYKTLSGEDLRIGGEGMKGFYDQILPRFMDKYGKKWGVKTGEVELPNIGDNGLTMWSVDVTPEMRESVMEGQPMFFKTEEGEVLGYTLNGEIYIDPRVATPDTPIHEYTHLWAQVLRSSNPTAWAQLTEEMKGVEDGRLWEYVRGRYPELKNEDELTEEVFAHYSGKRGRERLEADMREEMSKTHDVFEKAKVATMFHKLREILSKFWNMARDLFAGKVEGIEKLTAEDFADMVLGDLARGYNPRAAEEKTLMGVHNISEEKLKKALKQGGFANPSMAVIDTKHHMHTDYGEISLIPSSDLLDTKTGRNAGTFTADAWTPTYPQVVKRMESKGSSDMYKDMEKAFGSDISEFGSKMRIRFDEYLEHNSSPELLAYWYLTERGLNPEKVISDSGIPAEEKAEYKEVMGDKRYFSELDEAGSKKFLELLAKSRGQSLDEMLAEFQGLKAKNQERLKTEQDDFRKKRIQRIIEEIDEYGLPYSHISDYIDKMNNAIRNDGTLDIHATLNDARNRMLAEHSEDFKKWLAEKEAKYGVEEYLWNGTDNQGRNKWVKNTLENASKLMKKQGRNGAMDWGTVGNKMATVAKRITTKQQIRKARKNLSATDEEHEAFIDKWETIMSDIASKCYDGDIFYGDARLQEALGTKNPVEHLKREYGVELSEEDKKNIETFIHEVRENYPTSYFETKFERPVMLDEFAVAVVPDNVSEDVKQALEDAGLTVVSYEHGNEESRKNVTLDAVSGRDDIMFQKGRTVNDDIRFRSLDPESDEVVDNAEVGTKPLSDKEKVAKLEAEPKVKVYRAMQLIDGKLYPPMSAKVDGKLREPSELGVWEEADENPDMADENGKFTLNKGNGKSLKAAYNPYIHTSATMLNDQFSEAQSRPNLVVVEMEVPESEVEGDYRAEKAKDTVGRKQWKAGVIQGQLSGTREVILSRWAKPVRIVPDAEVAESIAKQIEGQVPVMPSNVVTPQVREEMEKLGVQFVETDNTGKLKEGENAGKTWASVFGKGKSLSEVTRIGEGPQVTYTPYDEALKEAKKAGYTKAQFDRYIERVWKQRKKTAERFAEKLNLGDRVNVILDIDELEGMNLTDRQKRAKGWYDTKTGKIYVIMDNNTGMDDVFQTILHEGVAHHGLRELFGENFDTFLDDVYAHSTEDIRREITSLSKKYNWNVRTATEEYMAKMAETQNFEHPQYESWWRMVKDWFIRMVKKIGMGDWIGNHTITENELRFVLWRSWKNLTEPEGNWGYVRQAQDIAMQAELGVGEYADKAPYGRDWKVEKPREEVPAAASGDVKYDELKAQVPDKVIMMKNGELYEIKGEDAKTAAQLLGLPTGEDGVLRIPEDMMEKSLSKLVRSGKKVAIAEPIAENKVAEDGIMLRDGEEELEGKEEDIWKDKTIGMQERMTAAKLRMAEQNKESLEARNEAVKALGGNLEKLRAAMNAQRDYDRQTVKNMSDLARIMMQYGYMEDMNKGEVKRLLSAVKNATGKTDVTKEINTVMDIMIDNTLKRAVRQLSALEKIKASKVDTKGVVVGGKLDPAGQQYIKAFREAKEWDENTLNGMISEMENKMTDKNETIATEAAWRASAYMRAMEYVQNIKKNKIAERQLKDELREEEAKLYDVEEVEITDDEGNVILNAEGEPKTKKVRHVKEEFAGDKDNPKRKQIEQTVAAIEETIRQNKIERLEAYNKLTGKMGGSLADSMKKALELKEKDKQRVMDIQHAANSDGEGLELKGHNEDNKLQKLNESVFIRFAASPLATYEQMMRLFGRRSLDGKGYLYDRFMRGWNDAADGQWTMQRRYYQKIDEKAKELFGAKTKRLYGKVGKKKEGLEVNYWDGAEMRPKILTQDQLGYLYAVEKMPQGKATNRRMGITDEVMEKIEETLDPKLKEFIDWAQDELFPELRNECNEVHREMFGADMDNIENYFPFVRDTENTALKDTEPGAQKQPKNYISTTTGAIKKRTASTAIWDMPNISAIDVIIKHIDEMSQWKNFAKLNRDLGTLNGYKHFRQQVMGMHTVYGGGKELLEEWEKLCAIATGAYVQGDSRLDRYSTTIAKGVALNKVAFRPFTAMKQLTSNPAFWGEANPIYMMEDLASLGLIPWYKSKTNKGDVENCVMWAWRNMPSFRKRWEDRTAGDYRLRSTQYDDKGWMQKVMAKTQWGMIPNMSVDAWTIALGSHAIYRTAKDKYKRWEYPEEKAERMAIQDAEQFNKSQQSSESAYLSTVQSENTYAAGSAMLFRNSSTSYTREAITSARNVRRMLNGTVTKEDVAKQMLRLKYGDMRSEFSEEEWEKAMKNAGRDYREALLRNTVNTAIFGWFLPYVWRIGGKLPLIILPFLLASGDDDKKKKAKENAKAIFKQEAKNSVFGPVEGFAYGDVQAALLTLSFGLAEPDSKWKYIFREHPLYTEIKDILDELDKSNKKRALYDCFNTMAGVTTGISLQTLSEWTAAGFEFFGGEEKKAREWALFVARMMNCPQSQLDQIYFDEIDMSAAEAIRYTPKEIAERWARYQVKRGYMPWDWNNDELIAKKRKTADKIVKERMETMGDEKVNEAYNEIVSEVAPMKEMVKEANKVMKTDYAEGAKQWEKIWAEEDAYMKYKDFKDMDKNLDELVKAYLQSETPEDAAKYQKAIGDYKKAMVEAMQAYGTSDYDALNDKASNLYYEARPEEE